MLTSKVTPLSLRSPMCGASVCMSISQGSIPFYIRLATRPDWAIFKGTLFREQPRIVISFPVLLCRRALQVLGDL